MMAAFLAIVAVLSSAIGFVITVYGIVVFKSFELGAVGTSLVVGGLILSLFCDSNNRRR